MRWIVAIAGICLSLAVHADDTATDIRLRNGTVLTVKEITDHRGIPYSYYDQAMESIATLYPDYVLILKRRVGTLGNAQYSIVCYKESPNRTRVRIGGSVAGAKKAWSFAAEVPEQAFNESLVLALETISNLPRRR
ncbi:MAG: hypothetical protein WAL83_08545 [Arenicellales bacterium]